MSEKAGQLEQKAAGHSAATLRREIIKPEGPHSEAYFQLSRFHFLEVLQLSHPAPPASDEVFEHINS